MNLMETLTQNLGVTHDQARGGAGLIFRLAKDKLRRADYKQLSSSVPEANDLIGAAPEPEGMGGIVGGISGVGGNVGGLISLAGSFSKLGLGSDMVSKFVPIILSYVRSKGGDNAKGMMEHVLK